MICTKCPCHRRPAEKNLGPISGQIEELLTLEVGSNSVGHTVGTYLAQDLLGIRKYTKYTKYVAAYKLYTSKYIPTYLLKKICAM